MPEDLVRSQKIDSLDLVVVASEFSPRRVEMIVSASPWRMRVYFWQVDFCHTRKLTGPLYECFCVSFSPMPQCLCFCIAFPFEYQSLRSCEESLHHLQQLRKLTWIKEKCDHINLSWSKTQHSSHSWMIHIFFITMDYHLKMLE